MRTRSLKCDGPAMWSFEEGIRFVCSVTALILFSGCAGVAVTPLKPDGISKLPHAEPGLRYYMPMPYLMVVELPPTLGSNSPGSGPNVEKKDNPPPKTSPSNPGTGSNDDHSAFSSEPAATAPNDKTGSPSKPNGSTPQTNTESGNPSPSGSAPVSDTSFMAATPQYMVRLVYLPDLRRPMAMTQSTGLFGTSQMQPVLQDGWMLTSLNANADSKVSETLTALASIAGAAMGTGGNGGTKAASQTKTLTESLGPPAPKESHILRPGLYRFEYDKDGVLTGLLPVVFFDGSKGTLPPSRD
jgi:hypothetical protein